MTSDDENQQITTKTPPQKAPLWIKAFLTINVISLIGVVIWILASGPAVPIPGDDPGGAMTQKVEDAVTIEKSMVNNQEPADLTGSLSKKLTYTIDATKMDRWVYFKFSDGSTFFAPNIVRNSEKWDIAFRRSKIISNGGQTNPKGQVATARLAKVAFDSVTKVADNLEFYTDVNGSNPAEPDNVAYDKWYIYDFWSHQLKPKPLVYVVKTVDGHYAKFQIVRYYCGKAAACYTFDYVYQGKDSSSFVD